MKSCYKKKEKDDIFSNLVHLDLIKKNLEINLNIYIYIKSIPNK